MHVHAHPYPYIFVYINASKPKWWTLQICWIGAFIKLNKKNTSITYGCYRTIKQCQWKAYICAYWNVEIGMGQPECIRTKLTHTHTQKLKIQNQKFSKTEKKQQLKYIYKPTYKMCMPQTHVICCCVFDLRMCVLRMGWGEPNILQSRYLVCCLLCVFIESM